MLIILNIIGGGIALIFFGFPAAIGAVIGGTIGYKLIESYINHQES